MGMSASQARLLSITARLNDVEFKSQNIANIKIRLADESEQLAMKYTQALGQQKYQLRTWSNGQEQKVDLTLNSLMQPDSRYKLVSRSGKTVMSSSKYNIFKTTSDRASNVQDYYKNIEEYKKLGAYPSDANLDGDFWRRAQIDTNRSDNKNGERILGNESAVYAIAMMTNGECWCWDHLEKKYGTSDFSELERLSNGQISKELYETHREEYKSLVNLSVTDKDSDGYIKSISISYPNVIGVDASASNDPAWLYNVIESGEFVLVDTQTGEEVTASNTVALEQVTDSSQFAKAEAEYNAANMKINNKEKLLDNELRKLDTEHNALQTEADSIKNLVGKNIEKSFSLFS